jgi:DNA-directed RNA polymerase subunit RPC12/RpoP
MRINKNILNRPRCESCGNRLYRSHHPFRNYFWGTVPSHCPRCGKEVSLDQKNQLIEHEGLLWLQICGIVIIFVIVVLIIV